MIKTKELIKKYETESVSLKKRLLISIIILSMLTTVVIVSSYAWITLSTRPAVKSVATTVASNGALEIALLTTGTYNDPSLISSGIGQSLDLPNMEEANLRWGNLVSLDSESYGLNKIELFPSMLNAIKHASGETSIGSSILKIPFYGYDGRVMSIDANSVSGIYSDNSFLINIDQQTYGVRAIGTANKLSLQKKTLMSARSSLYASNNIARQSAVETVKKYGTVVIELLYRHQKNNSVNVYTEDINKLRYLSNGVEKCLDNLDVVIRNGLIAIIASEIKDEEQFEKTYDIISNVDMPLTRALGFLPFSFSGSAAITNWVEEIDSLKNAMRFVSASCENLKNSNASWEQIEPLVKEFADPSKIYIGEDSFETSETIPLGAGISLMPNSGVLSLIADYVGGYSTYAKGWTGERVNSDHEIIVRTENSTGYLALLTGIVQNLDVSDNTASVSEIKDICGYIVDLAFRVNAENASLLLKTNPSIKTNEFDETETGGGSYMTFASENIDEETVIKIMNALRVTFVDSEGVVLGMAKLNVSNYENDRGKIIAPLYLYDYVAYNDSIDTGERNDDMAKLADLPQNTPVIVSAVVWLDGDAIDNTLVSISRRTVTAELNLQFATDVELVSAEQ